MDGDNDQVGMQFFWRTYINNFYKAKTSMNNKLELTGERVIEDDYLNTPEGHFIYLTHSASYKFAEKHCKNKEILDFGCGSGYGSASISKVATNIKAVDVSQEAINFAQEHYQKDNLEFSRIDKDTRLPFDDESFDVVLSFQVIEHITRDADYLREAQRLLRKGGAIIIITPDRKNRLFPFQKPWNRWHVREYSLYELSSLVGEFFIIDAELMMGASYDAAKAELMRYRKVKLLTLPLTMPFIPEKLRIAGLNFMQFLNQRKKHTNKPSSLDAKISSLDENVLQIGESVENSLNLIVVGIK